MRAETVKVHSFQIFLLLALEPDVLARNWAFRLTGVFKRGAVTNASWSPRRPLFRLVARKQKSYRQSEEDNMATPATPKATTGPLATVHRYVDAFNGGDVKAMSAAFAVPAAILDGRPPHVWQGITASEDWYRDVLVMTKKEGATDFWISLGAPLHLEITGDRAYVVVPATMRFKVHGQQITQSGAVFTLALRQHGEGWFITAWAWAKGTRQQG